jgi:hypothetical protein
MEDLFFPDRRQAPLIALFFLLSAALLFPWGKKEEEPKEIRDTEWVLCVTAFDISRLPGSRQAVGEVLQRSLVASLNAVSYRIRVSPEYAWYEGRAWALDQGTAAKALAAKREERDRLIYQGEPNWRYRRSIKTIDSEIEKLEEALRKAEAERPPVANEPAFRFTQGNQEGTFPDSPEAGREYQFCRDQQADAFLSGTVGEYYGRIYIALKLYTAYTGTYVYEDRIIFSSDDINATADELSGRLVAVVSGAEPAEIAVKTGIPDSLILLNHSFAGRGDLERQERPPGKTTIEIFAPGYESAQAEAELKSGELTEVAADLRPLELSPVLIEAGGTNVLSVYQGALYMGEAPLTLMLPLNRFDHIYAENLNGETAELVFPVRPAVDPGSFGLGTQNWFSQNVSFNLFGKKSFLEDGNRLVLYTKPLPVGENRVDRARRRYYWSWAGTWVTGIAAWMIYGSYQSQYDALKLSPNQDMYDAALQTGYIAMGSIGLVSLAVLVEIFNMARYINVAGEDAPAMIK